MKKLITICLLLASIFIANAQNTNVRAQGNYYSAKSNFQNKNYEEALKYVNKSKTALVGTNRELQYLHILAAYNLYKFEEAAKELQTYFDMEEKKVKIVYFDKSVDRLTNDETKELSMLIDPILESVENLKNNPCNRCSGAGQMKKSIACDDCNGDGFLKDKCYKCIGHDGKVECQCNGKECVDGSPCILGGHYCIHNQTRRCSFCDKGMVKCKNCGGNGYLKKECNKCHNAGNVDSTTEEVTCNKCYGKGF